jgi:peptidoglycan/LPS O-acetylase OafA/YrhL
VPRLFGVAGRHPGWCWVAAAATFAIAAGALHLTRQPLAVLPRRGEMGRQVCYGLTALLLVLPGAADPHGAGAIRQLLRSRLAAALGLVSYGIFLWHFDWLTKLLRWGAGGWVPEARLASVLALTVGVTLPFAALSYLVVERPLIGRSPQPGLASR